MSNVTLSQVAATLGLTATAALTLSKNPAFPAPVSGSGLGSQWNSTAVTSFAALWSSVKSRGWQITIAAMPTANVSFMAANSPGARYTPPLADPLWDF